MSECDLAEHELVSPDCIVMRFSPWSPERVLEDAEDVHAYSGSAEDPRYFSSVFVVSAEDEDLGVRQALAAAQAAHINPASNTKYAICRAHDLVDLGFSFKKERYDEEEEAHYAVDLGADPTVAVVASFLSPFKKEKSEGKWPPPPQLR